jgi:two-component system OmpR family sensor kinase
MTMTAEAETTTVATTVVATMTTDPPAAGRRRRAGPGVRVRILAWYAALLAVAIAADLVITRAILLRRLDTEISQSFDRARQELGQLAAGRDPLTGQPFDSNVTAIFDTFLRRNVPEEGEGYFTFVGGAPYKRSLGAPLPLDADPVLVQRWANLGATADVGTIDTEAGPVRFLAVPIQLDGRTLGVFAVANFLRGERQEIESTVRTSAALAGGLLAVASLVAWLATGRILRPVRQLTETARSISDTDLTTRIPVHGNDEIAELTLTFNAMLDRLAGAFAIQRAFIDDAGHELRTPITIVRGHLELLGDDPIERRDTIALVTDELDRMARIVDDLLLLAKAEQPDFIRQEPVEISDLTTELLVKAHALAERDWRLDACASGTIQADPQRLTQAVLNLARNAAEHTVRGAEIALGSAVSHAELRLWVRDTGPGIEPDDQQRIFERFTRGRGGRHRSEGAGLGLAIVKAVAEAHSGRVELWSQPGQGAVFTIVLPAQRLGWEPADDTAVWAPPVATRS